MDAEYVSRSEVAETSLQHNSMLCIHLLYVSAFSLSHSLLKPRRWMKGKINTKKEYIHSEIKDGKDGAAE